MTQPTPFPPSGADPISAAAALPEEAALQTLQRSGQRPLTFTGVELCMAMSFTPGSPFWYEVNVYRSDDNRFVVRVAMFTTAEDDPEVKRAWECESFGEVMDSLEIYDPAGDLHLGMPADAVGQSALDLAAHALSLRARAAEARRQYAGLIGDLLYELQTG
ncbi:MAG: hypothetical protein AAF713_12745 [Pseudomonadota bacterium]